MLETIRQYATEQLGSSGETNELHRHHADHYLTLAEDACPHLREVALRGPLLDPGDWVDRLESEHDNLRAALDWLEATGETQSVVQMAGALTEFWFANNHFTELRRRLPQALAADDRPTAARARALLGAADTAGFSGDLGSSRLYAEEGLALYRRLGNRSGSADALSRLAATFGEEGDHLTARPLLEESLALFRELDDPDSIGAVTRQLAHGHRELGEWKRARALYVENLNRARQLDNRRLEAQSLGALALIAADHGPAKAALQLAGEHLQVARDLGRFDLSIAFSRIAYVLARAGSPAAAVRILSCTDALIEEIGATEPWVVGQNEQIRVMTSEQLGDAAFAEAFEQGRTLTADEAIALARAELG